MPTGKRVKVQLLKNTNGTYRLVINPIDVWVKRNNQEVIWQTENVTVDANLDKGDGTPFAQGAFSAPDPTVPTSTEGGNTGSPTNKVEQMYGYTLTITPKPSISFRNHGTLQPIVIDPIIVVDDIGPPSTHKKKAATKKGAKKGAKKKSAKKKGAKKRGRRR